MDSLLAEAFMATETLSRQPIKCKTPCDSAQIAVVFKSSPQIVLTDYEDKAQCELLLSKTTATPIQYRPAIFNSADAAKDWYHDLTQGDGPDGEDLYRRCDGSCSPIYTSTVIKEGENFKITTSIICGHARDKDDDQYLLESGIQWLCPS